MNDRDLKTAQARASNAAHLFGLAMGGFRKRNAEIFTARQHLAVALLLTLPDTAPRALRRELQAIRDCAYDYAAGESNPNAQQANQPMSTDEDKRTNADILRDNAKGTADACGMTYRDVLKEIIEDPSHEADDTGIPPAEIVAWAKAELRKT